MQNLPSTPVPVQGGIIYASSDGGASWTEEVKYEATYFQKTGGGTYYLSYPYGYPHYWKFDSFWAPMTQIGLGSIVSNEGGDVVVGLENVHPHLFYYDPTSEKWDLVRDDCNSIYYDFQSDTICAICGDENNLYVYSPPYETRLVRPNVKYVSSVTGVFYIVDSITNEIYRLDIRTGATQVIGSNGGPLAGTNSDIYYLDESTGIVYWFNSQSDAWEAIANGAASISANASNKYLTMIHATDNSLWVYEGEPGKWRKIRDNVISGGVVFLKVYCIVSE